MEIRINTFGENAFSIKTFFSDEKGFEVASLIVMGKRDAVLIDASGHYQTPIESSQRKRKQAKS